MIGGRMRRLALLGASLVVVALLAVGALPAGGAGPRQILLPIVAREAPPAPTAAPVPSALHIQYRAFSEDGGWSAWQDEGGECGLFGTNKSIYSFEIHLFNQLAGTVFTYTGHFQNRGDLTWSSDNVGTNVNGTLGTPSEKFHLEGLRVAINPAPTR